MHPKLQIHAKYPPQQLRRKRLLAGGPDHPPNVVPSRAAQPTLRVAGNDLVQLSCATAGPSVDGAHAACPLACCLNTDVFGRSERGEPGGGGVGEDVPWGSGVSAQSSGLFVWYKRRMRKEGDRTYTQWIVQFQTRRSLLQGFHLLKSRIQKSLHPLCQWASVL